LQRIARQSWSFVLLQSDNPFWQFSLAVYAAPGVAAECLALEKASDIDVNMLLFCAWLGARKTVMTPEDIEAFEAIVSPWRQSIVRPLRAARDAMKVMPEMAHEDIRALRKQILEVELRTEQIQQALLFQAVTDRPRAPTAASEDKAVRANLRTFLQSKAQAREASLSGLSVDRLTHAAVTIAA
jgi:uncharacterized protein (TIGR02444 family)